MLLLSRVKSYYCGLYDEPSRNIHHKQAHCEWYRMLHMACHDIDSSECFFPSAHFTWCLVRAQEILKVSGLLAQVATVSLATIKSRIEHYPGGSYSSFHFQAELTFQVAFDWELLPYCCVIAFQFIAQSTSLLYLQAFCLKPSKPQIKVSCEPS